MWLCQAEVLHTSHVCKRFLSWHIFDPLIKVEPPSLCHLLQCALAEKNQTCRYCIWKSHRTTYKSGARPLTLDASHVMVSAELACNPINCQTLRHMDDDGTAKVIVTMISCVCARLIWWFICWGAFRTKTCIMYMGDPTAIKGDWQGLQQASSPALCRTNWQLAALPFSRAGFHLTKSMLSSSGKRGRGLIIIGVKNQVGWWVTRWWHWLHPD